ncbi:hypothetical protein AgCh_017048 [Apium graveolens]
MDLDLALRKEQPVPTTYDPKMDQIEKWGSIAKSTSAKKFLSEIEQYFSKNEKAKMSNLLSKLVTMKYKGKGNIREYIIGMSNLDGKLKELKLELSDELLVHLVLISLPPQFGHFVKRKRGMDIASGKPKHQLQEKQDKGTTCSIKAVRSDRGGEYYGRYDRPGEQHPGPFANFLKECEIVPQYTIPGKPNMNGVVERQNCTLKDMVRSMISRSSLPESLWGDALKTAIYILNQLRQGHIGRMKRNWTLGREDIGPLVQDNTEIPHEEPIEQTQQPHESQEVPLRRSTRKRKSVIPDDYVVFLQEHEDGIGIGEDDPVNLQQAMLSPNSQKWIDAMNEKCNI